MPDEIDPILVKIDALKSAVAAQINKEGEGLDPVSIAMGLLALDITAELFKSIFAMEHLLSCVELQLSRLTGDES